MNCTTYFTVSNSFKKTKNNHKYLEVVGISHYEKLWNHRDKRELQDFRSTKLFYECSTFFDVKFYFKIFSNCKVKHILVILLYLSGLNMMEGILTKYNSLGSLQNLMKPS